MKFKFILVVLVSIFNFSNFTKAAGWSRWSVDGLTPSASLYVYTNKPTSFTIHVICTRGMNETGFTLHFAVGSSNFTGAWNYYATFDITAADFDNYNPGGVLLDYTKVITIDARTQSLGENRLWLWDNTNNPPLIAYSPTFPFIHIDNQGTYDQFPSWYNSTTFNYDDGSFVSVNGTIINVSDTQPILVVGQSIYSPNQKNRLTLQTDGNLVLYKTNTDGSQTAIWASGTQGKPSASLYLQTDGNLVIYPGTNTPTNHVANSALWASHISASALGAVKYAFYRLQDDGNFVFYWPNYYSYYGLIYIVAGASDSQNGVSSHMGNLNHPLWSPAMQQTTGSSYTPVPL